VTAEMAIRFDLEPEDVQTLLEALTIYLADFRREVAGTEIPDFRHTLQRKQNALERLIADLQRQGREGAAVRAPGSMPATLEALARSVDLPPAIIERVAVLVSSGRHSFCQNVDLALELLGGVIPDWPLLSAWNRWCLETGARFFVWQPARGELSDRARLEALVHTITMIAAKEQTIAQYRASGVRDVQITLAGDDCVVCDEHRHRVVPVANGPIEALPPFHPGCRCGFLPRLE